MFRYCRISIFIALFILIMGCAGPKEYVKGVLGLSVHALKNQKDGRFSETFSSDYKKCYARSISTLKTMNARIFVNDEKGHCIGACEFEDVFVHCLDATEVGIFFEEIKKEETKVDVVSKNSRLSEFVSKQLFENLRD